jgi:hypothetical protein
MAVGFVILTHRPSFTARKIPGQFLATDPEDRVPFPALPGRKKIVRLERGPLSLVSTTEQLLDRKVAAPV